MIGTQTISIGVFLITTLLSIFTSAQFLQPFQPLNVYDDIITAGPIQAHINFQRGPVQIETGFHLKSFPRLPFLPPIRGGFTPLQNQIPPYFPKKLFTPNFEHQPAETVGQVNEYNKAIEEELEEMEKEQSQLTTSQFQDGFYKPNTYSKSYVNVDQGQGSKRVTYGYSV